MGRLTDSVREVFMAQRQEQQSNFYTGTITVVLRLTKYMQLRATELAERTFSLVWDHWVIGIGTSFDNFHTRVDQHLTKVYFRTDPGTGNIGFIQFTLSTANLMRENLEGAEQVFQETRVSRCIPESSRCRAPLEPRPLPAGARIGDGNDGGEYEPRQERPLAIFYNIGPPLPSSYQGNPPGRSIRPQQQQQQQPPVSLSYNPAYPSERGSRSSHQYSLVEASYSNGENINGYYPARGRRQQLQQQQQPLPPLPPQRTHSSPRQQHQQWSSYSTPGSEESSRLSRKRYSDNIDDDCAPVKKVPRHRGRSRSPPPEETRRHRSPSRSRSPSPVKRAKGRHSHRRRVSPSPGSGSDSYSSDEYDEPGQQLKVDRGNQEREEISIETSVPPLPNEI